jgi:phosphoribosylformimino-5-aminoimidazole carboxamide ribotide isomerase
MLILPAIDLKNGHVVRLLQGRAEDETIYSDDPASQALRWALAGAKYLHLVDLDGAFSGQGANAEAVRSIVKAVDIPCELGGGIRDMGTASQYLMSGVSRVIIGTAAVKDPDMVARTVERFGSERVVVGLDARDGMVAVEGWTETSELTATDLALQMRGRGITRIIYTDISRDGMSTGPNIDMTVKLAEATGMNIIASGGVGSLDHVRELARYDCIEGVIIGKALYDGRINIGEVLEIVK